MTSPLVARLHAALPQTQCQRCGYPDCRRYAQAIADGEAGINQCPPGGEEGVRRLSEITGQPVVPIASEFGEEGPIRLARIDETWCIGCTLCIKACPVDCIIGAPKQMHTVITEDCTGCELCALACPVDCIEFDVPAPQLTGWAAWSHAQAQDSLRRYEDTLSRRRRLAKEQEDRLVAKAEHKLAHLEEVSKLTDPQALTSKRAVIEAALARARAKAAQRDAASHRSPPQAGTGPDTGPDTEPD